MMIAALTLGGCVSGEQDDRARQAAARADSSAAGYAVGVMPDSSSDSVPVEPVEPVASAAAVTTGARADSARVSASTTQVPSAAQVRAPASSPAAGGAASGGVTTAARRAPIGATQPARIPPARRVSDSVQPATPAAGVADARVRVNEFLSYDPSAKTASLQLVAGYNGLNGALNFNGGAKGSQTITVPLGWKVESSFVNRDGDLPHSAIVVREVNPIPVESPPAAFPRAFTVRLEEGLQEGGMDDLSFVANKEGRFLIFCGVPGHGQGGMWIHLVVSPSASAPTYQ